jgi:hypothetical protein
LLEAGLEIGLATLGSFAAGTTPGLTDRRSDGRLRGAGRAISAAGTGAPSEDVVIRVP